MLSADLRSTSCKEMLLAGSTEQLVGSYKVFVVPPPDKGLIGSPDVVGYGLFDLEALFRILAYSLQVADQYM